MFFYKGPNHIYFQKELFKKWNLVVITILEGNAKNVFISGSAEKELFVFGSSVC